VSMIRRRLSVSTWIAWLLLALVAMTALGGCGGKGAKAAQTAADLDSTPLALLAASPIVVASLDARAMFADGQAGAALGTMADSLVALPASADFVASRDVNHVTAGLYAATKPDIVAVLSGRFDLAKITSVTKDKSGAPLTWTSYAGFATTITRGAMIAPLTSKTLLAGTPDAVRASLDRIKSGTTTPALPAQTIEALKAVAVGVVADFASQPIALASLGSIHLPWLKGLRSAHAAGDFNPPGFNASITLAYGDPGQAKSAVDGIRSVNRLVTLLGPLLGGIRVENLRATSSGDETKVQFALSQSSLEALLGLAGQFLASSSP
ncbi:MAG: hypothetical protein ACREJ3_06155, partial [Polyangiaceae bacterium]